MCSPVHIRFHPQADTDDVDSLRRQLDSGNGPALLAIRGTTDPHVLATALKQVTAGISLSPSSRGLL